MKPKILFILHLPPPVHGSSMVGQYIKDSKIINTSFVAQYINLSTSKTVDEIGKYPILKIGRYFKLVFKFIWYLFNFKPETIYLAITAKNVGFYKDLPFALLTKLFKKKLVLHYHNKGVCINQNKPFDNLLYHILFKNTKIILLSERLYKDVSKYVKKENVFFCPNGIPVINLEDKFFLKNNSVPKLLFLSNLIESKGVYILLDALKILNDNNVKFYCNMVGGEGDISLQELNNKIKVLNLSDSVNYLGKKHNKDKYDIFQLSDMFLFPTHYHNECFPLVLLEAMMFGLSIISTKEGGIPDIVKHGETGFIVDKQNPEKLAKKIKYLIDNPQKACLMREKGREYFLEKYTLDVFERRMEHILNQI